jgi:hypothetical protein
VVSDMTWAPLAQASRSVSSGDRENLFSMQIEEPLQRCTMGESSGTFRGLTGLLCRTKKNLNFLPNNSMKCVSEDCFAAFSGNINFCGAYWLQMR